MIPRNVLVTGATGALGQSVVARLTQAGIHVVGTHSGKAPAATPLVTWVEMDVTRSDSISAGLKVAGDVDGLVHCAGGFRFGHVDALTDTDLDFLLTLNLRSPLLLLRALVPGMKQRNFGRVVLVGASSALHPGAGVAAYTATKAGVHAVTQAVAAEVKAFNITVNAVLPSLMDTPVNRKDMPDADFSSWVTTAQMAEVIFALMSDAATPVHGALLPVTGRT